MIILTREVLKGLVNNIHGTQLADSQPRPAAAGGLGLGLCGHLGTDGREAREAEEVYSEHSRLTGALV